MTKGWVIRLPRPVRANADRNGRDVRHPPFAERRALAFCVFDLTRGRGFAPNERAANEWMRWRETKDRCLESPFNLRWFVRIWVRRISLNVYEECSRMWARSSRGQPELSQGWNRQEKVMGVVEQGREAELEVEVAGRFVDRVDLDRSDSDLISQELDASQGIGQKQGAQPAALGTEIDRESAKQDDWDVDPRQSLGLVIG